MVLNTFREKMHSQLIHFIYRSMKKLTRANQFLDHLKIALPIGEVEIFLRSVSINP